MLKLGVSEPFMKLWTSPILPVLNLDGDPGRILTMTLFGSYSLPWIDNLIDKDLTDTFSTFTRHMFPKQLTLQLLYTDSAVEGKGPFQGHNSNNMAIGEV